MVMYNQTVFGSSAVYSCEDGYQLQSREGVGQVGVVTRVCMLNSQWNGDDLSCSGKLIQMPTYMCIAMYIHAWDINPYKSDLFTQF